MKTAMLDSTEYSRFSFGGGGNWLRSLDGATMAGSNWLAKREFRRGINLVAVFSGPLSSYRAGTIQMR